MKRQWKKAVASAMMLSMLLGTLPASAFAADIPRKDKSAIVTTQEDIDEIEEIRALHRARAKDKADKTKSNDRMTVKTYDDEEYKLAVQEHEKKREEKAQIERREEMKRREKESKEVALTQEIRYDFEEENIDAIVTYIQEKVAPNFKIERFEVTKNMANVYCAEERIATSLRFSMKNGEFTTNNCYYISVTRGIVDMMSIIGNPDCLQEESAAGMKSMDEAVLKELALAEIKLGDGEAMTAQTVYKRFDTEPYYIVTTNIVNEANDIGRLENFRYRHTV